MASPVLNQERFRGRNDDGSESGATWKTTGSNQNWSNGTGADNRFRVRLVIRESNSRNSNNSYILFYSHNSGTYTNVTTSSNVIQGIVSKNTTWTITDGDATTEQLAWAGGGTWVAGYYDDNQATSAVALNNQYTEMEYCLYLVDADVNNGDVIDLRVYISPSTALNNYNQTPRITVVKAVTKSISDTGTGIDARPSISASLSRTDSGVGTDQKPTISASISQIDSSIGNDVISVMEFGHNEVNVRVVGSENDAHERDNVTGFSYTAALLNATSSATDSARWNSGMRFITNIPEGAEIQHAYLTVNCINLGVDDPNVNILGELSSSTVDFSVSGTVTNRVRTSGSVSWVDTGVGISTVESPDISSVIQEIVNQSGFDGTLVLFLDGKSDSPSSFNIYSYDGSPILAPLLHVGYHYTASESDAGSGIDQRPTISASLSVSENGSGSDDVSITEAITKSLADAGSGVDSPEISASLGLTDGALGGDYLDLSASLSLSDSGSGIEDETVNKEITKSVSDSGSEDETISISASLFVSDVGLGTDEINVTEEGEILKSISDGGTGIDDPSILAELSMGDDSSGFESPSISASLTVVDSTSASDLIDVISEVIKSILDSGYGLDAVSQISVSLSMSDSGSSADEIAQLLASMIINDFGYGADVVVKSDTSTEIYEIFITNFQKPTISVELSQPVVKFLLIT